MEKLIFVRQSRNRYAGKSEVVRVNSEAYNAIVTVAHEAGVSVQKAASAMIQFAIEHVVFVEEEENFEIKKGEIKQ